MMKMIQSVKFKKVHNTFLTKIKDNTTAIKHKKKLLIAADKTIHFINRQALSHRPQTQETI